MNRLTNKDDFFTHLRQQRTSHVLIASETSQFDDSIPADWRAEGFHVSYIAFNRGGADFVRRLQAQADAQVGVSEQYAIISFGAPGAPLLTSLRSLPRLAALVAYYPPQIPSAQHAGPAPPHVTVQLHLCAGSTVAISRRPEVLGLQGGKIRTTPKRVGSGAGLGGGLELLAGSRAFVYEARPGFAEADVDAYSPSSRELAWGRALAAVRRALGLEPPDLERVKDEFFDAIVDGRDPGEGLPESCPGRINVPTLTGGFDREGLRAFYREIFAPSAHLLRAKLVSRTVGAAQVVDEMIISFKHDAVVEWILPRVPPTGRMVRIPVVSIVGIKGGRCVSERLYWDQASVLVQIGMLDPAVVPKGFSTTSGKKAPGLRMPVVGAEQAAAVDEGEAWEGSVNELCDGVDKTGIK